MQPIALDNLDSEIVNYFRLLFNNDQINSDTRLIDLSLDSMDQIELSLFILKTTGAWLDISKINDLTRLSTISSCVFMLDKEDKEQVNKEIVVLDRYQRYVYSDQLKNKDNLKVTFVISYLYLKEHMDIPKLKQAIKDTLDNHFVLNSKISRLADDYHIVRTPSQAKLTFKGSLIFPKRDLAKLVIKVHDDRLVNIYLQRKRRHYYLIVAFHHIAMDGWSQRIIQEEIFRRYAGLHNLPPKNIIEDVSAINKIYPFSIKEQSNTDELRALFMNIDPYEYGHLDHFFYGKLQINQTSLVISKDELDRYAKLNNIEHFPHCVIFSFMFHQMVSQASKVEKLIFFMPLSNRHLPIPGINTLVGNIANGLPLFLSSENTDSKQFAAQIDASLKIYFKHMSYGAVTRILLEKNTLLNNFMSPSRQAYVLTFSYLNNVSKTVYGNDSITGHYVDWNKSETHVYLEHIRRLSFDMHNLGSEFFIQIRSRMVKNIHHAMVNDFLRLHFPTVARN